MTRRFVISSCAAAMLSLSGAAAQTTTQTPTQSPVPGSTQGTTGQTRVRPDAATAARITVIGCVMHEADYTKSRGGVLGTGVGGGNEFVLAGAMPVASSAPGSAQIPGGLSGSTSAGKPQPAPPGAGAPIGTSGTASAPARSSAYELTGSREADLAQHVGKRVEIVGTIGSSGNASAPAGGGAPASGDSSGAARAGASRQAQGAGNLPDLTIVSFRPLEGTCR